MTDSFEDRYINKMEDEKSATDNFVFPKKSSETKEAFDKAEIKINNSVKTFANNLDSIKPGLTRKLLDIFDKVKSDPKYKGLSTSDLWLHSLGELYKTGEIPSPLESILNEMMQLLNDYKVLRNKSKTLEDMLRACAFADNHELKEGGRDPNKPLFTWQSSHEWGRGKL